MDWSQNNRPAPVPVLSWRPPALKPNDFGPATYRVLVFDPNDAPSDPCKDFNVVKGPKRPFGGCSAGGSAGEGAAGEGGSGA